MICRAAGNKDNLVKALYLLLRQVQTLKSYSARFVDKFRQSAPDCRRLFRDLLEHIVLIAALVGIAVKGFYFDFTFSDSASVKVKYFQTVLFEYADLSVVYPENTVAFSCNGGNVAGKIYTAA